MGRWRQSRDTHCVVSNAKLVDSQYVRERKNKVSSMEPLKGAHPIYPMISTSGLVDSERINFHCFTSASLC